MNLDATDRTPSAGLGIHTEMCIDPALDWRGCSVGPVTVYCAITLGVLGRSDAAVRLTNGRLPLTFGGVRFIAQPVGGASRWWRLYAVASERDRQIDDLRTFALAHNEIAFVHLCDEALYQLACNPNGGEHCWAAERVNVVIFEIGRTTARHRDEVSLGFIRSTDTTRPDGAIARSIQL